MHTSIKHFSYFFVTSFCLLALFLYTPSITHAQTPDCSFTRDLSVGSRGQDVNCLQRFLKAEGHLSGNTTNYFGPITRSAVSDWQRAEGISPAEGYFGPISRSAYQSEVGQTTQTTQTVSNTTQDTIRSALQQQIRSLMKQVISLLQKKLAQTLDRAGIDRAQFASQLGGDFGRSVANEASDERSSPQGNSSSASDNSGDNGGGGGDTSSASDNPNNPSSGGGGSSDNSNNSNDTGSLAGDKAALDALYTATNGDEWWNNTGWEDGTPKTMDQMYGVTVWESGEFAGRVKEIDLFQNNLVGTIESVPFDALTAVQRMTLKQPLTSEEFFASDPDGQVATNPPPKISGQLPASIGDMQNLEWLSLGGQYCRIDMSPGSWNEWNHCPGFGSGKKYVNGNFFEGELPPEWGQLTNLEMLEIRRSNLDGTVPAEWEGMTSLVGIYLNDNILKGRLPEFANSPDLRQIYLNFNRRSDTQHDGFTGSVPETYAQLQNLNHLRLSYNDLSGELPVFDTATDLRTFDINRNDLTRFPMEIFQNGRNPLLNYFLVYQNPLGGTLEERPIDPNNHNFQYFAISHTDMGGELPSWASNLRVDLFNFDNNHFTSLGEGFYDPDAPIYSDVRNMRLYNNELEGELPDALFAVSSHNGTVASKESDTVIELNMDLGIVESGTVSVASSEWIRDDSKRGGPWDGADFSDHTVIIDPDGLAIEFEVLEDTNVEGGYLYSRDRADPSETEGLDYVIRPSIKERIIRFKTADNRWLARDIVSVDYDNNRVTVDKPIEQDVSGLAFSVHERDSGTWMILFNNNKLTGPIPQSWGYIPTRRDAEINVSNNKLSGEIPDLSRVGIHNDGSLAELEYDNNQFVFKDIIPNFAANNAAAGTHNYAPQKPFGDSASYSYAEGDTITIDYFNNDVTHGDNQYQWQKDGNDISGATSRTLTINNADTGDAGTYTLEVTNPSVPNLTLESKEIGISVGGVQGVQTTKNSLQSQLNKIKQQALQLLDTLMGR